MDLGNIPTTLPRVSLPPAESLNFSLSLSTWKEKNTQRTQAEGYCGSWLGSFQLCVYQLHPLMVSARTGHPQEGLAGWSGLQLFLPVSVCVCVYRAGMDDPRARPSGACLHLFTTQLMSWLNIFFSVFMACAALICLR